MPTPVLHKVGAEFDERNMFLQAALGVIALLQRGRALLAGYGTASGSARSLGQIPLNPPLPKGEAGVRRESTVGTADDEHPFLYLVLGAIALSHHLLRHLPALRAPSSAHRLASDQRADAPVAERSLRELLE